MDFEEDQWWTNFWLSDPLILISIFSLNWMIFTQIFKVVYNFETLYSILASFATQLRVHIFYRPLNHLVCNRMPSPLPTRLGGEAGQAGWFEFLLHPLNRPTPQTPLPPPSPISWDISPLSICSIYFSSDSFYFQSAALVGHRRHMKPWLLLSLSYL
jgi:hypothetical protein